MDLKRVREPKPVGSVCKAAPTSLYTPGNNDSSALSMIPARFTKIKVTVSAFIFIFTFIFIIFDSFSLSPFLFLKGKIKIKNQSSKTKWLKEGRGLARYDGRVELLCDGVLNGHSNFKQRVLLISNLLDLGE